MPSKSLSILPDAQPSENGEKVQSTLSSFKKGARFWLIFVSMCICLFLSALELSSVSTALPTIANALHTTQSTWSGSAYALSSAAFLPMSGGLAQAFGPYKIWVAAAFSLTAVVLADLVTLKERGVYTGLYALTWCLAASIGPVLGGSLATQGQWRWLFYLNLPISFVAGILVLFLLDQPMPSGSYRDKLMRLNWIGNFLVISSTAAYTIGLTWGGITASWGSVTILVPLVVGLIGLGVFIAYEATLATHPLVPLSLMTNLTSISGYVITAAVVYYLPVYFQACKGASPVQSGVYSLAIASLGPGAILTGISVKATGRYRPQIWLAWAIAVIACGLMSTLRAVDPLGVSIGYAALVGWSLGMLNTTPIYPIQAALPVTQNAPVVTFMWFVRSLAIVWGITVGSTVLQNELAKELPVSFIQSVPQATAIVYALIPQLPTLPPGTRFEVQVAFASSLAVLWRALCAISGAGLVASLLMRGLPLQNMLDANWALRNEEVDRLI